MIKNDVLTGITIKKFKGIKPYIFLPALRKIGLEFIEISKSIFEDLPLFIENIGNIKTGFHLPNQHDDKFDLGCISHEADINQLIDNINKNHKKLNIKYCLSHPPECISQDTSEEESINFLFKNLKKLEPVVILENIQDWNQEKFELFYEKAKEELGDKLVGQCFDAPHYFLQGNNPVEFLKNCKRGINHIHLSDCSQNQDSHLPFGMGGVLPVDEILNTLKQCNFHGFIDLELLPRKFDDIKELMQSYLKVLRVFNPVKYYITQFKLIFFAPLFKNILKKVLSN